MVTVCQQNGSTLSAVILYLSGAYCLQAESAVFIFEPLICLDSGQTPRVYLKLLSFQKLHA